MRAFIVNACLGKSPNGFTVYDCGGQRALAVAGRKSWYGSSTASPNTRDALIGEIHPTTVKDILENHLVPELPTRERAAIEKIRINGEAELTSKK